MTNKFEPNTTFYIRELNKEVIIIKEVEKVVFLIVQCLKYHLLFIDNQITFFLLTKVPR